MPTLRDSLTQPKPLVDFQTKNVRNAQSDAWPKLDPDHPFELWNEFNLETLNRSYGDVLDCPHPPEAYTIPQDDVPVLRIVGPGDMKGLITRTKLVVERTLDFTKIKLQLHDGITLNHHPRDEAPARLAGFSLRVALDHNIFLEEDPTRNLVVGFGRATTEWSGYDWQTELAKPLAEQPSNLRLLIRQLANTCVLAKTRYGYIQTATETIACCFSKNGDTFKAKIRPVRWSKHGSTMLTTDMTVWWMAVLAMAEGTTNEIVPEGEIVPIDTWDLVPLDDQHRYVRRHHYSGATEPAPPPPPPAVEGMDDAWLNLQADFGGFWDGNDIYMGYQ